MPQRSKIEWTHSTWNPSIGCTKISPGCANCYAEKWALRLQGIGARGYENGFDLNMLPERLSQPLSRRKPTTYFVNSMSDLFHEEIDDSFLEKVFDIIAQTPHHIYQVLTKRADRMARFFCDTVPPKNAWLGVSVENIKHGLPRIHYLRKTKAAVKFLSIEPLLEDLGQIDLSGIQWVIVGGESGASARRMEASWVENVKDQCLQSEIPFFFKQWGTWGADGAKRSKVRNGRLLSGREWNEMPIDSR
ncbi:MAG: phage Gp37/Gp68 family protein [Syntrophobacter sp.]